MPFDAMVTPITIEQPDSLARLGIVPVPPKLVAEHKRLIEDEYCRAAPSNYYNLSHGVAVWRTMTYTHSHIMWNLRRFRAIPWADDRSPPPRQLTKLAGYVARRLDEPLFRVDYFYTDPILHVMYDNGQIACLGIWDSGEIVHIASRPLPWYRRLFG